MGPLVSMYGAFRSIIIINVCDDTATMLTFRLE